MNICKACKNAYITHSLSVYHITCKYDRNDYSFSDKRTCNIFKLDKDFELYENLPMEGFAPPEFLTEEEFHV